MNVPSCHSRTSNDRQLLVQLALELTFHWITECIFLHLSRRNCSATMHAKVGPTMASRSGISLTPPTKKSISFTSLSGFIRNINKAQSMPGSELTHIPAQIVGPCLLGRCYSSCRSHEWAASHRPDGWRCTWACRGRGLVEC